MQKSNFINRSIRSGIAAACVVAALGACASWRDNVHGQLDNARSVVGAAKTAGAERYAPEILASADNYLRQAEQYLIMGKLEDATRNIQQAAADGQLAKAQAETRSTSTQVEQLRQEIASLMK